MSGRGTPGPAVTPSGFFVLRTPLLPFTEVTAWGDGLQAPAVAGDPEALAEAVVTDRLLLRRAARGHRHRRPSSVTPCSSPRRAWRQRSTYGARTRTATGAAPPSGRSSPTSCGPRPGPPRSGSSPGARPGVIGAGTCLRLGGRGRYRRHTRLDMDYLWALAEAVRARSSACAANWTTGRTPASTRPETGCCSPRRGRAGRPVLPARGRGRDTVPDADPRPGAGRRPARHPGRRACRRRHHPRRRRRVHRRARRQPGPGRRRPAAADRSPAGGHLRWRPWAATSAVPASRTGSARRPALSPRSTPTASGCRPSGTGRPRPSWTGSGVPGPVALRAGRPDEAGR